MPSNPVDEAREQLVEAFRDGDETDLADAGLALEQVIREQERSRYEGLLREIIEASEEWVIEDAPPIRLARAIGRAAAALTPSAPAETTERGS